MQQAGAVLRDEIKHSRTDLVSKVGLVEILLGKQCHQLLKLAFNVLHKQKGNNNVLYIKKKLTLQRDGKIPQTLNGSNSFLYCREPVWPHDKAVGW